MKKSTLALILIATLVGGIVFVSSSALAASVTNPKASDANNENNGNGNGNGANGNSGTQDNGNGANGGNDGNGNGGSNGNSDNSGNGNSGNTNSGTDDNGNGNSNNGNNGNNGNGNGGSNDNTNGNNGDGANSGNGNGGSGDNGNGNSNGNGNGDNANNGNGSNGESNDNGNAGNANNGNGNSGNSGNSGNDNGGNANNGNNGNNGNSNGNSRFKISGYILDSNGKVIEGAEIIYNVPEIVPAQFSDSSGYYEIYAPAGQYQVDVWPPFNSHYIFFEQKGLTVTADMHMNMVLQTGSKLSGFITTTAGAPVSGAVVWLSNTAQGTKYFCGWYSRADGSYFVTAPPGTYTLKIQPKPGLTFPSYSEVITIAGDQVRNFVIGNQNNPVITSTHTSTLSISMSYNSLQAGSILHLNGQLLDQNANPLASKTIILSYAVANTGTYTPIGSATTDSSGLYKIDWLIPASGIFTLKVDWAGNSEYYPASSTTTLTFSASN